MTSSLVLHSAACPSPLEQRITIQLRPCRVAPRSVGGWCSLEELWEVWDSILLFHLGSGNLQPTRLGRTTSVPRTAKTPTHQNCGSNLMCRCKTSAVWSFFWFPLPRLIPPIPKISILKKTFKRKQYMYSWVNYDNTEQVPKRRLENMRNTAGKLLQQTEGISF